MAEQLLESDDGDGSAGMEVKQATFHKWKFRHYFAVVEVWCKLCAPSNKTLSSACNTTSNLMKHLSTVHKATSLTPGKKSDDNEESHTKRQCTLPSVSKLNSAVAKYGS